MTLHHRIPVMLVDDHSCVRRGYREILEANGLCQVQSECHRGESAILEYVRLEPDVVLMDVALPGISGLETTRRLTNRFKNANILITTGKTDVILAKQALRAGATGFISKKSVDDELIKAVELTALGKPYLDPCVASHLAYDRVMEQGSVIDVLNPREYEIFRLQVSGVSTDNIARQHNLCYKTVANYSSRIKSKLGVDGIADLTRLAIRHGVIEP